MMQKRDQLILQYVNQKGKVSVVELSEMLSVAVETIRRDLTALENKGLLHRIHGAAVISISAEKQCRCQKSHRTKCP